MPIIVSFTARLVGTGKRLPRQYVRDEHAPNTAEAATRFSHMEEARKRADEIAENGRALAYRHAFTFDHVSK